MWALTPLPPCWSQPATTPRRMKSERSFAALCGASPVQASSGQTIRHRLNRGGGNRQANNALWPMRYHPDTHRRSHQRLRGTRRQGEAKTPSGRSPAASSGTSPHRSTDCSPTRHQHRTATHLRNRRTSTRQHHSSPRPPTSLGYTTHPHIGTRARPLPQPPTRHPIPDSGSYTRPTGPICTEIGAIIGASNSSEPEGTMEGSRPGRVRHPRIRRLVQPPPAPRTNRTHPPGRERRPTTTVSTPQHH